MPESDWSASCRLLQTPGCWPGSGHKAVSSAIPGSLCCRAGRSRACPWGLCRPLPGMVTRAGVGRCGWWSHRCGPCSARPPCTSSLAVVTGAHRWRRGPHPWGWFGRWPHPCIPSAAAGQSGLGCLPPSSCHASVRFCPSFGDLHECVKTLGLLLSWNLGTLSEHALHGALSSV